MFEGLDRQKRHQTHQRSNLQGNQAAIRQMQGVVEEAVFLIPKAQAATVVTGHGPGNAQEVLEEFAGRILINRIVLGQFQGHF